MSAESSQVSPVPGKKILTRPPNPKPAHPSASVSTVGTGSKILLKRRDKTPMILQRTVVSEPERTSSTTTPAVSASQPVMETVTSIVKGNRGPGPSPASGPLPMLRPLQFPAKEALTLIDNSGRFVGDFDFMSPEQKGSADFLVVTCIGPQGSGKSTISSYLSGKTEFGDKSIFRQRPGGNLRASSFFISQDSIIFIEVAPVLCGSAALDLVHYGSLENATISWNLRLMRWALSVSHVVLVTSESLVDPNLCRLITSAEMIHPMESAFDEGAYPEVLFVCNKVPLSYIDDPVLGSEVEEMLQGVIGRRPRISPSFFLLPHTKYNYGPAESQRYEELKSKLLEFNRYNRSPFSEVIEGKPKIGQNITLTEWLTFAGRLWDEMDAPAFFSAYAKLLP